MDTVETVHIFPARSPFLSDTALILYLALFKLCIHFTTNVYCGYGYIRDELYYIACSNHLARGIWIADLETRMRTLTLLLL
jgi:hypothetical protein